jgi:hypothetical protein
MIKKTIKLALVALLAFSFQPTAHAAVVPFTQKGQMLNVTTPAVSIIPTSTAVQPIDYSAAYTRAIEDAKDAYPDEVRSLVALVPSNKDTTWKEGKILMASLIPEWAINQFYMPALKAGGAYTTPTIAGVFMWTTPVPQLKNFIAKYNARRKTAIDPELLPRVEMLLGLPIKPGNFYVTQFWVDPKYIFRPCPDPKITTEKCDADTRKDNPSFNIFDILHEDPKYIDWYLNEKKNKYTGSNPFPWTRLGYTYDYYKKERFHDATGLSEYVIEQGVPITIESITPLEQY